MFLSRTYFENYIQEQCIRGDNEIVRLCLTYNRVINCNNFTLNWCGENCFVFMNEGFLVFIFYNISMFLADKTRKTDVLILRKLLASFAISIIKSRMVYKNVPNTPVLVLSIFYSFCIKLESCRMYPSSLIKLLLSPIPLLCEWKRYAHPCSQIKQAIDTAVYLNILINSAWFEVSKQK